jgi:Putative Ig domain
MMLSYKNFGRTLKTATQCIALGLTLLAASSASAQLARVGPVDPADGFPKWYQDKNGVALEHCVPNPSELTAGLCLLLPGDMSFPVSFPDAYPDESFYYNATADMTVNGGRARLVISHESAFGLGAASAGDQIVFARIRFVIDIPAPGGTYKIISPYLEKEFPNVAPGKRAIFFTEDVGLAPGDFAAALKGHIGPFLRPSALPGTDPLPFIVVNGKTYLGDAATLTPVTGSPLGPDKNIFRIEGPNIGGTGIDFIETPLFTVMGRVHTDPIPSPLAVDRATYVRDATSGWIDVFSTATAGIGKPEPSLSLAAGSIAPKAMSKKGSKFYAQLSLANPQSVPATVTVTNNGDTPPSVFTANLVDEVNIRKAEYDGATKRLTIQANSSDKVTNPTLIVDGPRPGPLDASGSLVIDNVVVPPATITVRSSLGGMDTATVSSPSAFAKSASALVATVVGDNEVDLAWADNSSNESGFRIERAQDAAFTNDRREFSVAANTTSFVDSTAAGSRNYYYRVIAISPIGDSAPSNTATATTPAPTKPPVITNPGNQTGIEGRAVSLPIVASDYAGGNNPLTFTATGLPAGLTIDPASGVVSGQLSVLGTSSVTVSVSNGPFSVRVNFTWVVKGSLQPVSVTPNAGSGAAQTFQFTFSDAKGASDMKTLWIQVNSTTAYPNSCAMTYDVATKRLQVVKDDATGWQGALIPGTTGTLQNSQCSVDGATSSLSVAGEMLTLTLPITFKPAYIGTKNIYMRGLSSAGSDSGWQVMGTWTTASAVAQAPSVVSITPNTGTGTTQTFELVLSDVNGFRFIKTAYAHVSASTAYPSSCAVMYDAASNKLFLIRDDGANWIGSLTPGSTATLQNSQCALAGSTSSVSGSGSALTLRFALTFDSLYRGTKNIYGRAVDQNGVDSGWQLKGSWTPTAAIPQAPTVVSATPNTGTGKVQAFQYTFSDVNGFRDIKTIWAQIATSTNYPGTCAMNYDAVNNRLYLVRDDATGWLGPITPGASATLQNSACTISGVGSAYNGSGVNGVLTVSYSFSATYTGTKTIFSRAQAQSGLDSGWQVKGSWTPQ